MTVIAYDMAKNLFSLALVYVLFFGVGYIVTLSTIIEKSKAVAFATPVIGFGWISVFSTWLYRIGLPASLGLIFVSLIVLFSCIVRFSQGKIDLFGYVRANIAQLLFIAGLVAFFANLPNLIGGVNFWIFQGNVVDQMNYDGISVAISKYDYGFLHDIHLEPNSFNDFIIYASTFLKARPSINVLEVTIAPLFFQPLLQSSYLFNLVLQLLVFCAVSSLAKSFCGCSDRKSLLLGAACSLGFFVQYIMDINAWSQLASQSLILIALWCTIELLQSLKVDEGAYKGFLRSASIATVVTPVAYIYPEMLVPLLAGLLVATIYPVIADRDLRSALRRILSLGGGTIITIVLCLPFWSGTIGFMVKQIGFAASDTNQWYKIYQKYIFYSSIKENLYSGYYAIFAWPVDFMYGVLGLYFLRPPTELSLGIRIFWKIILYVPLFIIISSFVYSITESTRERKDLGLRMLHGASLSLVAMGAFICLCQQYWTAGKLLGEFGPLMLVLLCQQPSPSFLARKAANMTIIGLITANLMFGLERISSAADGSGLAHGSPAYPSSQYEFLKRSVDWSTSTIINDSDCRHISLAINHPILDHYLQLHLAMGGIPWASSLPINDYYGLVADRGYQTQTASDCQLDSSVNSAGRVEVELRRLEAFSREQSDVDYRRNEF